MTPLGSSPKTVIATVQKQKWQSDGLQAGGYNSGKSDVAVKSSIRASLGDYHGLPYLIFSTNVTVFWGFDERDQLIDVWVWKTVDAL